LQALSDGLYVLNYTKSTSFPETEAQYRAMGMDFRQNSIETYTDIVIEIDENSFLDPVELLTFSIDRRGVVSCPTNPTIVGIYNKRTGELYWSGYIEHFQQLKYARSTGKIEKITRKSKADMDNTLVYQLENSQGDLLTASFQDGFLLLKKTESGETSYLGWPTRVNPDGSFRSTLGIAIEVITGQTNAPPLVQALQNTTIVTEGKINEDGSIGITFYSDYALTKDSKNQLKTSFSGRILNSQEMIQKGENYEDFKIDLNTRSEALRTNRNYPDWYLNPPSDDTFLYASGCRSLADEEGALKMAETIAAAVLASQIKVRIQSDFLEVNGQTEEFVQEITTEKAKEELSYEVQESLYNDETKTAYVLIKMKKDTPQP